MDTIPQGKRCSRCKTIKDPSLFPPNPNQKDGLSAQCRECANLTSRESRARRKVETQANTRERHFLKAYNINLRDFFQIFEAQEGRCAICQSVPERALDLVVDHDHTTLKVRGLLCTRCNTGLGNFKDNPNFLEQAARYVAFNKTSFTARYGVREAEARREAEQEDAMQLAIL